MSGIAAFNSAVKQLQNSQRNLLAISQARQKMEQEKELIDLRKQEAQLNLEKAKRAGKMSELEYDILQGQHKQYIKQEEDKMNGNIASIKMAEHQSRSAAEQALNWAKIGFKSDPQGVLGFLGAMRRNESRTKELRPKFSYGRIGYEEVDTNEEDSDLEEKKLTLEGKKLDVDKKRREASGESISEKDVVSEARAMAKDDFSDLPYEQKLKKYIPIARELLSGKKSEVSNPKTSGMPKPNTNGMYDDETERLISGSMRQYKKQRKDVIRAMADKGLLIMN